MSDSIVGTTIGIYTVISECPYRAKDHHKLYNVRCNQCGFETEMRLSDISRPKCCKHMVKHGSDTFHTYIEWQNKRIEKIFLAMKQRCYNPNDPAYKWYGQKGIKIFQEWIDCPTMFEKWSFENGYADDLSIDRIDESKDYCPDNCHWISLSNNCKYKSTTNSLVVDGQLHSGKEWSKILNLGANTINRMLRTYDKEIVINFIHHRMQDPTATRELGQRWIDVYHIE